MLSVRNCNLSKYEELKQKYNDDSNTLYWNNKNLMVTEKFIYIYNKKYDFEDIIKVDTQNNILRPFIRLKVFGKPIPQSITHYIITLKDGNVFNVDPLRPKKLLLHKAEIRKLLQQVQRKGYTLIPLQLYLKDGRVKLELGVCMGKHLHDKRDAAAEREMERTAQRAVRTQSTD